MKHPTMCLSIRTIWPRRNSAARVCGLLLSLSRQHPSLTKLAQATPNFRFLIVHCKTCNEFLRHVWSKQTSLCLGNIIYQVIIMWEVIRKIDNSGETVGESIKFERKSRSWFSWSAGKIVHEINQKIFKMQGSKLLLYSITYSTNYPTTHTTHWSERTTKATNTLQITYNRKIQYSITFVTDQVIEFL